MDNLISNSKASEFQLELSNLKKKEELMAKNREKEEMLLKIEAYRKQYEIDSLKRLNEKLELNNINHQITRRKERDTKSHIEFQRNEEKQMIQNALNSLVKDERDFMGRRQLMKEINLANQQQALRKREEQHTHENLFSNDVDRMRREEAQKQIMREQMYRNKFENIRQRQEYAQSKFYDQFIKPTQERIQLIDQSFNHRHRSISFDSSIPSQIAARNIIKNKAYDPITDTVKVYQRNPQVHKSLGNSRPEHFPGKIIDRVPSMPTEIPVYKGMGYKKSNIFTN